MWMKKKNALLQIIIVDEDEKQLGTLFLSGQGREQHIP